MALEVADLLLKNGIVCFNLQRIRATVRVINQYEASKQKRFTTLAVNIYHFSLAAVVSWSIQVLI